MKAERVIVHHSLTADSGTVSWGAIRKFHMTDPNYLLVDIGYHAGVELVNDHYEILLGRGWNEVGAHAKGNNWNSLGICFIGNFDEVPCPDAQLVTGAKLIRYWLELFNIPAANVFPHSKFAMKTCPGKKFDMTKLITLVQG